MKNLMLMVIFLISYSFAGDNTAKVKVDGMVCSYSCSGKVSSIVQKIDGVKECNVDFDKGIATIKYDDTKIEQKDIVKGLESNSKFKATLIKAELKQENKTSKI